MSVEDEIRNKLVLGYSPQQLIQEGYRKSTVYKVHSNTKAQYVPITEPEWSVQNLTIQNSRFLPGQSIPLGFTFRNDSPLDIYLYRIGVRAEWMQVDSWYAQEVRNLVKSGAQRWFSFTVPIPRETKLGEYELLFGIDGQYLPSIQPQPTQTQWSDPVIIQVKKPMRGLRIFLSHSTADMALVRQLETSLDNEGIAVTIGEDVLQPGVILDQKFQRLIQESSIVLALLTENGARSEWVLKEVNYALQVNKPCILLKEESVSLDTSREWVKFSRLEPPDSIFQKIMNAINATSALTPINPVGGIIGLGILALILGALFGNK